MITALLLVAQLQGATVAWYELPTAHELHAVHPSAWARYHELHRHKTQGQAGSPVFREPMAASTVYYALWDKTGEQPVLLSAEAGERWRDMALSSASIAAEALLWDTVYRSDELGGAVRFMRTFVSPNLELQRRSDGWKAKANDPNVRLRPRLERHEHQEGMIRERERRYPTVTLGTGLEVADVDELTEAKRTVDASAWLRLQRFGLDKLTLRALAFSRSWEISARQRVVRGLSAGLAMSSKKVDYLPKDWGAGLTLTVPRVDWWTVVLRFRQDWPHPDLDEPEWSLRLTLRWLPPGHAPVGSERWPLGQQVGARGPVRPATPRGAPIETGPVPGTVSPAEASGSSAAPR